MFFVPDEEEVTKLKSNKSFLNLFKSGYGAPSGPEISGGPYLVTFKNWDGTILKQESVEEGHDATAPTDPIKTGYTFKG